jgi:hypothetical protein
MVAFWLLSVGILLLNLAFATASSPPRIHVLANSTSVNHGSLANGIPLLNHKGLVLRNANLYTVWVGYSATTPLASMLQTFVTSLNGSPFLQTLEQYVGGIPTVSALGQYFLPNAINIGCGNTNLLQIRNAICNLRTPKANDIYSWMTTQERPNNCNACGWHSSITCAGNIPVQVMFIFNSQLDQSCCINCRINIVRQKEPFASYLSVFTHELFETMSDPGPAYKGWWDSNQNEVGDKCAWKFGSGQYTTVGAQKYNIQSEWSNAKGMCVQYTATAATG